jgi:hypothetical protein
MRSAFMMLPVVMLLLGLAFQLQSCKRNSEEPVYEAFMASDCGIGVTIGMQSSDVRNRLGEPTGRTELQGGANEEWHYLNPSAEEAQQLPLVMQDDTPQLTITFHNEKLAAMYNLAASEEDDPEPPFIIEPVVGVKLGSRLSDFEKALGKTESETVGREWRFASDEEGTIRVLAHFEPLSEGSSELICTSLQVSWAGPVVIDRGEDLTPATR